MYYNVLPSYIYDSFYVRVDYLPLLLRDPECM